MFPQDTFTRGVRGENTKISNQGCFLYLDQNYPYYHYPRMPPHPNTNITPHPICLCTYCNSSPIHESDGFSYHTNIPQFGYLYRPPLSIIPSSMLTDLLPTDLHYHSSRRTGEHRRKRSNKRSNLMKRNRRDARRRRGDH